MAQYVFETKKDVREFYEKQFSKQRDRNPESFQHMVRHIEEFEGDISIVQIETDRAGIVIALLVDDGDRYITFMPRADHMPVARAYDFIEDIEPHQPLGIRKYEKADGREWFYTFLNDQAFPDSNVVSWSELNVTFYLIDSTYLYVVFHIEAKGDFIGFFLDRRDKEFLRELPNQQLRAMTNNYLEAPEKHRGNKKRMEKFYDRYAPESMKDFN